VCTILEISSLCQNCVEYEWKNMLSKNLPEVRNKNHQKKLNEQKYFRTEMMKIKAMKMQMIKMATF